MNKYKYAPMWQALNNEGNTVYYHYDDKIRAGNDSELKWVVMDRDYFIGTVQLAENFRVMTYETEEQAKNAIGSMVFI